MSTMTRRSWKFRSLGLAVTAASALCLLATAPAGAAPIRPGPASPTSKSVAAKEAQRLLDNAAAGVFENKGDASMESPTTTSGVTTLSAGLAAIVCSGVPQNPHYSSGAGGAISKLDVTCTGTGFSSVKLKVQGILQFAASSSKSDPGGAYITRSSLNGNPTDVPVNGPSTTWYLPPIGSNGGVGTGWWHAYYTYYFTAPNGGLSTVGTKEVELWCPLSAAHPSCP